MRNVDSAVWDRDKQNAVLFGNYAKFTQNDAMKDYLLSTGNIFLAEASPLDPAWGIGLRADDPSANQPRQWTGKFLRGEALSAVRELIRENEAGSAHPASSRRLRTLTGNAGIHEIVTAPQSCSLTTASTCHGPPSEFSTGRPKP